MDKVAINLGSGHWKLDGWINVDIDRQSRPDVCADLSATLPFRDRCADLMHTEDFIDQLDIHGAARLLRECHRILRPGGVLRVLTPDLERLARLYREGQDRLKRLWREEVGIDLVTGTAGEIFNLGMRFAGHTFLYDGETLSALAAACGFEARREDFRQSRVPELRGLDLRSPDRSVSMYFDCYRKP